MSTISKTQGQGTGAKRKTNRSKNRAGKTQKAQEKYTFKGETHLKEGVTGKMRRKALSKSNNAIKLERASYDRAIEDIFKHGTDFYSQVVMTKTQFKKQTTPRMIKDRMTTYNLFNAVNALDNEKRGFINYTPFMVMNCIERALKNTERNRYAVRFFDALDSGNDAEIKKAKAAIVRRYNKEKAEREAKKNKDAK